MCILQRTPTWGPIYFSSVVILILRHIITFVYHYIWGTGSILDMISNCFEPNGLVHYVMACAPAIQKLQIKRYKNYNVARVNRRALL